MNKNKGKWSPPYDLGLLPFVFSPLTQPRNGSDLPDFLPFSICIDSKTGTMMQMSNVRVSHALEKVYHMDSRGMMNDFGIGNEYANDFIQFLKSMLSVDRFDGLRILEIGCGTGYLLYLLKNLGAEVIGIEPGIHGQEGSIRYGVPIVQDFFPSSEIRGQYDLIILYAVVEHIEEPGSFLREVGKLLYPGGKIALSVPNCQPYLLSGDISLFIHEHWNYYTRDTLKITILRALGGDVYISDSNYGDGGGSLYAITTTGSAGEKLSNNGSAYTLLEAQRFCSLAQEHINRVASVLEVALQKDEEVGIYVPGRAINILSILQNKMKLPKLRFFDDNTYLHRKYYPGFPYPIESKNDFFEKPTYTVLIFSKTFGNQIKMALSRKLPNLNIMVWEEIFGECKPTEAENLARRQ